MIDANGRQPAGDESMHPIPRETAVLATTIVVHHHVPEFVEPARWAAGIVPVVARKAQVGYSSNLVFFWCDFEFNKRASPDHPDEALLRLGVQHWTT